MYTHNKTYTNIVHYVDRQNIIKTISKTTSTTSLLTFLLHLFILKLWPADMLFYRTYIMRNFTKMLRSRGVGSRWLLPKTNPQKHARKEKRWILMDIFRKTCLGTYQKITCEPNISWLEACRSKRPLNSYRPEQSLRRFSFIE